MPSRRSLEISDEAEQDLEDIFNYSTKTWGANQAAVYSDSIMDAIRDLAEFPELGRVREDIAPGARGRRVRDHVIVDRLDGDTILIDRVYHVRRDPARS